jgi:hypothetical protein
MGAGRLVLAVGIATVWAGGVACLDEANEVTQRLASASPVARSGFVDRFGYALGSVFGVGEASAAGVGCPDEYGGFAVTSMSPSQGDVGQTLEAIFCGRDFQPGAALKLSRPGSPDVLPVVGTTVFVSKYQLHATFNLTGVASGYWNPTVVNPGAISQSLTDGFLVWDATGVWEVFPGRAGNLATIRLTILGNGFQGLSTVRLVRGGVSVQGVNATVVTDEKLEADFALAGQPVGGWDLVAEYSDGSTRTLAQAVEVETPALAIRSLTPRRGGNVGSVRAVIEADYLKPDVSAKLRRGAQEIQGKGTQLTKAGLVTSFNLDHATLGSWDLVLSNGYVAGEAILAGGFTVDAGRVAEPWIDILGPSQVRFGQEDVFRVQIGNKGNVDTLVTPVIVGLPSDVQWRISLPNGTPAAIQYNEVREVVRDGKRSILLPLTSVPSNGQPVEYWLWLRIPDDDGDPTSNRALQLLAVIDE